MSADDPYGHVSTGKLRLKGDMGIKKKKKKKNKKLAEEATRSLDAAEQTEEDMIVSNIELKRTKAEMAFQKMQEKNQTKRILEKACMTHKERVEKFNQHLDSLTEHFDIPKVSWTK